jgi:ABC-type antimicrobial peptide transport system permease subunit
MSHAVARRRREIGVRMAFGAGARHVFGLVLRDGLTPVVAGLLLGVAAAAALGRAVAGQLFGVSLHDPLTYATAMILIMTTSIVALVWPARWAIRVDPVTVLRTE